MASSCPCGWKLTRLADRQREKETPDKPPLAFQIARERIARLREFLRKNSPDRPTLTPRPGARLPERAEAGEDREEEAAA
jgi:hypothetical protein